MAYDAQLPTPTFDLDTWAGNYEGAILPLRLAHVATHCPPLSRQSLVLGIAAAKKGKDVQVYSRLHDIANRLGLSELGDADSEWITRQEEANKRELARLEGELRGYKNNLIRESIRMGQEDLAMHLLLTGGPLPDPLNPQSLTKSGYHAAYEAFSKMRDYCTTPTHVASMTLRLIYTALLQAVSAQQQGSSPVMFLQTVIANASRLRTVGVKEEEMAKLTPIMHAVTGIAHLGMGNYRDAADSLLRTPIEYATLSPVHGTDFTRSVASGNDLAILGCLCVLATYSRDEVDAVLAGPFRQFLELEPHGRKAMGLFTTAKYQSSLATLHHYYSDWSLDVFLGAPASQLSEDSHVDRLLGRIRQKSITAYFSSFSQVSLTSLASTFPPRTATNPSSSTQPSPRQTAIAMENELLHMIESGNLSARLDVVNGLLISASPENDSESRKSTQVNAAAAAEEVERTLLLRLHKVNVALAGLEVPRPPGKGAWGGGGAGEGVRVGNGGVGMLY